MRDDIYARLGSWPHARRKFLVEFHKQYSGPDSMQYQAAEAAWWLRESLEDIDTLQARWQCLKPEVQSVVGKDWEALFE